MFSDLTDNSTILPNLKLMDLLQGFDEPNGHFPSFEKIIFQTGKIGKKNG